MIGTHIGRFRITAPLGRGGIATVWRAHDELLGRDVAVKILSEDLSESTKARRRFVHEAIATAKLSHPGIVSIHESGEHQGRAYIAYALIDGETVSDLASHRRVPVADVVRIAVDVANALAHAHSFGVIHRDVTGRNIMVARDGRVIVLDFGLALAVGMTRLTTSERAVGTVAYMSPEATLGKECDARTDLYGLGVVMYEMLTGRFPFPGDRPESMIYAKLNLVPDPPSAHRPEVPAALDRIVTRAIARLAEDRYASAEEMAGELRAVERSGLPEPAPVRPAPPPPAPRRVDSNQVTRPFPLYLAVLPFEIAGDQEVLPNLRAHVARFAEPLKDMLDRSGSIRAVPVPSTPTGDLRQIGRELGANAVLKGCAIVAGSRLRVTWGITDPESGGQWAGDVVDGSTLMPLDVQDRLVASVGRALDVSTSTSLEQAGRRPRDPAGGDRMIQAERYLERYDHEASVDGAIGILEKLISTEGDEPRFHAALARACLFKLQLTREGQWESRAAAACDRAVRSAPEAPEVMIALADLRAVTGNPAEARQLYERVLRAVPDSIEALIGLARTLEATGDADAAERACRAAIRARPRDWRGHGRLGRILYDRGRYSEAISPYQEVVRLSPDNVRGWRMLGTVYFHLDRFDDAVSAYGEALAIQPSAVTCSNLGTALLLQGRTDEAIDAFERACALGPSDAMAWGNLGNACHWIEGRGEVAQEALTRAVALMRERLERNPADAFGWMHFAGWVSNLGDHDEARVAIRRALELEPESGECMAYAGRVHLVGGDRATALTWLRKAVERGYGVGVLERSPALAPLREDPEFRRILEQAPAGRRTAAPPRSGGTG